MEEAGQDPLDDVQEVMEIPKLEATKQNLDSLNSDLEKDLQRMDEANQVLLKKIREKEETIQSLERDITLSVRQAREREELDHRIAEKEEALRDLELETAKLEKNKEILSRSVVEMQKEISRKFKNVGLDKEALKQMLAELKVKLQKSTESCASQEKELVKIESDYQSVYQLCEDQAHYIKKYQEILRQMEKEKEMLLLEKEVQGWTIQSAKTRLGADCGSDHELLIAKFRLKLKKVGKTIRPFRCKAQNNSTQIVKPGSTLVETIQSNMEKTIIKKQKRIFWYRHFRYLIFVVMIFFRLLGYVLFYLQYINPDLLVDVLPMVMSRETLTRLRDALFPFLTLEVEEVLPH
ncbi:transmembrane and coiled-coil domain-containing protein 5B [Bubalus kerabau]|uniref:transmembrane and coiled-coil domain-containing protein 5B n=1 Tax=Bubalus carabanensis TaxID=3119969 RepID=UPI001D0FCBD7|nr:transmembrane and coiled-coil domain-containing protein 5B [Bubalus carabanensis]